jgi:cell division protein FtsW
MPTRFDRPSFSAWFSRPLHFALFILLFSLLGLLFIFDASVPDSLQNYGISWHYAARHSVWVVIGFSIFLLLGQIPAKSWEKIAPIAFGVSITLLVAVLIPGIGVKLQGAQRWIALGPVPIQPSEITKLALIIFFSSWLSRHQRFAPFLFFTSVIAGLIMLQPNMSTAAIVVMLCTILYFLAGGKIKPLAWFGGIALALGIILILVAPYRRERLVTFLNPTIDPLNRSYHIRQITLALGRGGLFGQGIGLSKQKQQYIPEAANDSIFAILAEETGFIGSVSIIGLYILLLQAGLSITMAQKEPFAYLVGAGVTTWFALQIVLNLAAMVALVPLTGVPLPLISYGGSAYLSNMAGLGLLYRLLRESSGEAALPVLKNRKVKQRKLVRRL